MGNRLIGLSHILREEDKYAVRVVKEIHLEEKREKQHPSIGEGYNDMWLTGVSEEDGCN